MNKERIEKLAVTSGIYDCITDPYDKLKNGDSNSSVMPDLVRFAELIIQECISIASNQPNPTNLNYKLSERFVQDLKRHFGVK